MMSNVAELSRFQHDVVPSFQINKDHPTSTPGCWWWGLSKGNVTECQRNVVHLWMAWMLLATYQPVPEHCLTAWRCRRPCVWWTVQSMDTPHLTWRVIVKIWLGSKFSLGWHWQNTRVLRFIPDPLMPWHQGWSSAEHPWNLALCPC